MRIGVFLLGVYIGAIIIGIIATNVIGGGPGSFAIIKYECQKSIPRDQECVMVYEFVPVKTGEAK